jgi:CRP-like cAMP-binding protein
MTDSDPPPDRMQRPARARDLARRVATLGIPIPGRRRTRDSLRTRRATTQDIARLVAGVPALSLLDEPGRRDLVRACRVAAFPAGALVVRTGDASDAAYFVLRGRLAATVTGEDGERRVLSTMSAGDVVGEITALTGGPRTADVTAQEEAELLVVPAIALRRLASNPEARELLLSKLTERLARTAPAEGTAQAEPDGEPMEGGGTAAESLPRSYTD